MFTAMLLVLMAFLIYDVKKLIRCNTFDAQKINPMNDNRLSDKSLCPSHERRGQGGRSEISSFGKAVKMRSS